MQSPDVPAWLLVFGRTPKLSHEEIARVFPSLELTSVTPSIVATLGPLDPLALCNRLGGIVKVCSVTSEIAANDIDALAMTILNDAPTSKSFTLHGIGFEDCESVARVMKQLAKGNRHIRYQVPRDTESYLAGFYMSKKDEVEYLLLKRDTTVVVARTVAMQDIEEWSRFDMGRPVIDKRRGMLPLKVARMAINIAVGERITDKVIYDPFCGVGSILSEAMRLGAQTVGSDIERDAVQSSLKNISWLHSKLGAEAPSFHIFEADATHSASEVGTMVDAIVTEPYLGPVALGLGMDIDPEKIRNIIRGLEKLYIGSLREWRPLLRDGGTVMMAFPVITLGKNEYTVKRVIDSCERLGYSIEAGPMIYSRPQAVVKRQFYLLQKAVTNTYGTR